MNTALRLSVFCMLGFLANTLAFADGKRPPATFATQTLEWSEVRFQAKYKGATYPICRARDDEPVVVLPTGKTVRPVLESMELVPVDASAAQAHPDWLYLDNLKAEHNSVSDIDGGGSFNNTLNLQFAVEATKPLQNVFLVVSIITQRGPSGLLVREVGDLAAFHQRQVSFTLRLDGDFGAMSYRVFAFAGGRELWQPTRFPRAFLSPLSNAVRALQAVSESPLPTCYYSFPPRGFKRPLSKVAADVSIGPGGNVSSVVADPSLAEPERRKLAEAVRYWWFVPPRDAKGDVQFRIEIDLSDPANWGEESVRVLSRQAVAGDSSGR